MIPLTIVDIVLVAVALGVIQGISEWLPISSKTQILLFASVVLGMSFSQGYTLGLFLEGGTFLAAVFYLRREIVEVLKALVGRGTHEGKMLLKYLVVATAITAVIGVIIYKFITTYFTGPVVGIPLILLGILLLVDWGLIRFSSRHSQPHKDIKNMSILEMAYVGIVQGVAALPGVSRSGVTTSTMLFEGIKPDEAFRLSFLAGIPATIGASAVTLLVSHSSVAATVSYITPLGIAISLIVSLLVGFFVIKKLIKFAGHNTVSKLLFILGVIAIVSGIIVVIYPHG